MVYAETQAQTSDVKPTMFSLLMLCFCIVVFWWMMYGPCYASEISSIVDNAKYEQYEWAERERDRTRKCRGRQKEEKRRDAAIVIIKQWLELTGES